MRLVLTGTHSLRQMDDEAPGSKTGFKRLRVLYCGICKTDAKMWHEGHRDLVLPRVPGHEFVGLDEDRNRFAVWPGNACGRCRYCRSARENLCEDMRITGFHHDGGFAHYALVPENSLIPVPSGVTAPLACFAEPAGCVWHALGKLGPEKGRQVIIYGGGTLGLIAALMCRSRGAMPLVIEKNAEKIEKIRPFLDLARVRCMSDTRESEFDMALNACADHRALGHCIVKLGKGGKLSFFSGLQKNKTIDTNLANLMHYKEIDLYGAYGLNRTDMKAALGFIETHVEAFESLVEAIVPPENAPDLMPGVLAGHALKYILDFTVSFRQTYMKNKLDCGGLWS